MTRRFSHLQDVEVFLTVAASGSFTLAAVELSSTPSVLSRAVTRLEARLGTQLMRRTTRHLSLTGAGQAYLEQARTGFALFENAERAIQGQDGAVSGRVRLSVSTTYGHFRLPHKLARFAQQHPNVDVEVSISNRNVDLIAEGYDLAIRLGDLPNSGMVGRKLEDAALRLVASPDYLGRNGAPRSIADLANHTCLPFIVPSTGRPGQWIFRSDGNDVDWTPRGMLQVFDDVLGVVSMAEAGLGICQIYDFVVDERLARGSLVELLPDMAGRSRAFSLLFAPHRNLPIATRRLIDFLVV